MKRRKYWLSIGLGVCIVVVLAFVIDRRYVAITHTEDPIVDTTPKSPFPLLPVPKLENVLSDKEQFCIFDTKVQSFLTKWEIRGASLAIAKHGKLIYAKGFGYADVDKATAMQPYHVMRIASVSKLITATTIMTLVADGKLALNDTVFGPRGILNDSIFCNIKDKRILKVTVRNLLNHTAGWTTKYGDPVFMPYIVAQERHITPPVSSKEVVSYVLGKRMHYPTGTQSSYVNIGYVILGEVIEKVSGMSYEEYVTTHVLAPMGIAHMRIGHSYPSQWFQDEVCYYEVPEAEQIPAYDNMQQLVYRARGGNNIPMIGAAGGWTASPAELLRFVLCIDGCEDTPDILPLALIDSMTTTPTSSIDPLGWRTIHKDAKIRTGSFAGTAAIAVSDTLGYTWVMVTNTSAWTGAMFPMQIYSMMAPLIHQEAARWDESNDLFFLSKTISNVHLRTSD